MDKKTILYEYLNENFEKDEPIFLADIALDQLNARQIRYYIKQLADENKIGRFNSGIYYLPKYTIFGQQIPLSPDKIATRKYVKDKSGQFGFYSGNILANQMGLSDQVPYTLEITSSKAPAPVREINIGNQRFIVRRSPVSINDKNCNIVKLLECLSDLDNFIEGRPEDYTDVFSKYCRAYKINKADINEYISYFPKKIYEMAYRTGVETYVSS